MPADLTPQTLTLYLLLGAGVVTLLLALANVRNIGRAAGLICFTVSIAVVGLIVQGNDNKLLLYIAGFSLLAGISLISGYLGGRSSSGGHSAGDAGGGEHH